MRDENGRFDRHGKTLAKAAKRGEIKKPDGNQELFKGKPGPGRPKGSKNRTTLQLREAILAALDEVGGHRYLAKLAIENSSAFASLLGKVLPTTLTSDSDGGGVGVVVFRREIVYPNGHVEGVTKQIAPPASHVLPMSDEVVVSSNEIKEIE